VQNDLLQGRFELIDGEIISKMGQKPAHRLVMMIITRLLMHLFGEEYIQCQSTIDIGDIDAEINEPEPDVAVTVDPNSGYSDRHPGPADLLLVVEVSDTTLRFDLRNKAELYAHAGIKEYWVADIIGRRLVVHRQPTAQGYDEVLEFMEEETITPHARPEADVRVRDLLPPI